MEPEPKSLFNLDSEVAIVTGASSGLGARFARVLTAAGARVVLAGRRESLLDEVARQCPGSVAVACDVTMDAQRRKLVATAVERFGRVDVLVNNAGVSGVVPAVEQGIDEFASTVAVNLTATFALCQLVAPGMLDNGGGSIVNVASIYGIVASGGLPQAAYAASKGGVVNLTRELSAQWADRGVRVNALCPGWFRSELTEEMFNDKGISWITRRTPMRRTGEHHELDGALLFLASAASSYVTGIALPVDGGYLAI
jgi:NAD(P)-dependent dehydrogenase (short-subunit alcohol dehydrogenase family)